jgi:hypothetical protein
MSSLKKLLCTSLLNYAFREISYYYRESTLLKLTKAIKRNCVFPREPVIIYLTTYHFFDFTAFTKFYPILPLFSAKFIKRVVSEHFL